MAPTARVAAVAVNVVPLEVRAAITAQGAVVVDGITSRVAPVRQG